MAHWYDETDIPLAAMPVLVTRPAYTVHNGQLWVIGGSEGFSATGVIQSYDPSINEWTHHGTYPSGEGSIRQAGAACSDGALIWFTTDSGAWVGTSLNLTLYSLNPLTGTITRHADPPHQLASYDSSLLHYDGKLYVGMDRRPYAYDIATDTWTELAISEHSDTRAGTQSVLDSVNGIIYSVLFNAGRIGQYDIATDTWAADPDPATSAVRTLYGFAYFEDGLVHILGGETPTQSAPTANWGVYDPAVGSGSILQQLPVPLKRAAAGWIDGQLFMFGGTTVALNVGEDVRLLYSHGLFKTLDVTYEMPVPVVAELPVLYNMTPLPPAPSARFWRLRFAEHAGGWISVRRVELRSESGGDNLATQPQHAIGTPDSGYEYAFTDNEWVFELALPDGWLGYDFGLPVSIREVVITNGYALEMPTLWAVEVSNDGSTWEPVSEIADAAPWNENGEQRTYGLEYDMPSEPVVKTLNVSYTMPLEGAIVQTLDVTYDSQVVTPEVPVPVTRFLTVTHHTREPGITVTQTLPAHYRMRGNHIQELMVQHSMLIRNAPQDPLPEPGPPPGDGVPHPPPVPALIVTRLLEVKAQVH